MLFGARNNMKKITHLRRYSPKLIASVTGLAEPVEEHRFHPVRKWRFDFAWPDLMIALEVDGGAFANGRHTRGAGFISDMEKLNTAASLGWHVFRTTPQGVYSHTLGRMIADLARAKIVSGFERR